MRVFGGVGLGRAVFVEVVVGGDVRVGGHRLIDPVGAACVRKLTRCLADAGGDRFVGAFAAGEGDAVEEGDEGGAYTCRSRSEERGVLYELAATEVERFGSYFVYGRAQRLGKTGDARRETDNGQRTLSDSVENLIGRTKDRPVPGSPGHLQLIRSIGPGFEVG